MSNENGNRSRQGTERRNRRNDSSHGHANHPYDPDNDPPCSRLFVVAGKKINEKDLYELFSPFGDIQYCKAVLDHATQQPKGCSYVKFSKASEAALAMESLDGQELGEGPHLKVTIAQPKLNRRQQQTQPQIPLTDSFHPEDNPPNSRLFFAGANGKSEDELSLDFAKFGGEGQMEYCTVIKDKKTGESKGFGYVKFLSAPAALRAMEQMNDKIKSSGGKMSVSIAKPKFSQNYGYPIGGTVYYPDNNGQYSTPYPGLMASPFLGSDHPSPLTIDGKIRNRLFVVVSKAATQPELEQLFSKYPGMDYCDLKINKATGESKGFAYIGYSTSASAQMAKDALDGREYPEGCSLRVTFADPTALDIAGLHVSPQNATGFSMVTIPGTPKAEVSSPAVTAAPMPHHKGLDMEGPDGSRLFFVQTGSPFTEAELAGMFSQYQGLEYIRLQKNKNYGYAKYNNPDSAQSAIENFDGKDFDGTSLKVQIAHPPKMSALNKSLTDLNIAAHKRQKT